MPANGSHLPATPQWEVSPPTRRRVFSRAQKEVILQQIEQCTKPGQVGALLRREGIYSSYLNAWRREKAEGWRSGGRGRPLALDLKSQEIERLKQENSSLKEELTKVQMILDMQKKMVEVLFPGSKQIQPSGSC